MKISLLLAATVAALALVACGGDTTTVITSDPTASTEGYDINADIADQIAVSGGGEALASICAQIAKGYPREASLQQGVRQLGPVIIKEGGDPTTVVGLLLDRC